MIAYRVGRGCDADFSWARGLEGGETGLEPCAGGNVSAERLARHCVKLLLCYLGGEERGVARRDIFEYLWIPTAIATA